MKLELSFNCDNACFDHGMLFQEISRVLTTVGQMISSTENKDGRIFDCNGNVIGEFKITGY